MSYSQAGQDLEALKVCGPKGFYVDVGCAYPDIRNNTKLLEESGWDGLLMDINVGHIKACENTRSGVAKCVDLSKVPIGEILDQMDCPKHIDYLSIDVDAATEMVVTEFPYQRYTFTFATIEHDAYREGTERRDRMRKILQANGYKLYREDVVVPKKSDMVAPIISEKGEFEDWYIRES